MKFRSRLITKSALAGVMVAAGAGTAFAGAASASPIQHGITTIAGNGTAGYSGDGKVAVNAELNTPSGIAEDLAGNLYIGDTSNNRVRMVVKPTTLNADLISTFAGSATAGFAGDGGVATSAELNTPTGVAVGPSSNVFIADTANGRIRVVAGTTATFYGQSMIAGHIYTVAGNGTSCGRNSAPTSGTATAVDFCGPTGVAADSAGDFFVADTGHNKVFEVSPKGALTTYAGTGSCGYSGDGHAATAAQLCGPTGLALDSTGNLYISDTANSVIRKVSGGTITTFAGEGGKFGYNGDNIKATSAKLFAPTGVTLDSSGDVFISDTGNMRIREVIPAGTISTYAGTGTPGFSGDGGEAAAAKIFLPTGSGAIDGTALYFADTGNQRVRGVFNGPPPVLPESPWAILLPLAVLGLLAGGGFVLIRRNHRNASFASAV